MKKNIISALALSLVLFAAPYVHHASAAGWSTTTLSVGPWWNIATSADGTRSMVIEDPTTVSSSRVMITTDSGLHWTAVTSIGIHHWTDVSSSLDGVHLIAVADPNIVATSNDAGVTWSTTTLPVTGTRSVTSDGTGKYLALTTASDFFTSNDYGATWARSTTMPAGSLNPVKYSSDGSHLYAQRTSSDTTILYSLDHGASWASYTTAPFSSYKIATNANGKYLVLGLGGTTYGAPAVSSDYGASWIVPSMPSARHFWNSFAVDATGQHMEAVDGLTNAVWLSNDYGSTWSADTTPTTGGIYAVGSSSNGKFLIAAQTAGTAWTKSYSLKVTTGTASALATTSATLAGTLSDDGRANGATTIAFDWGRTTSYGSTLGAGTTTALGAFNATLTGLECNVTYYFRAKASNDTGSVVAPTGGTFHTPACNVNINSGGLNATGTFTDGTTIVRTSALPAHGGSVVSYSSSGCTIKTGTGQTTGTSLAGKETTCAIDVTTPLAQSLSTYFAKVFPSAGSN